MPNSPVTGLNNTTLIQKYSTTEITSLYFREGIDIKRFFTNLNDIELHACNDTAYRFFYPANIFGDDLFYQDLYKKIPGYYHVNRWEHQQAKKKIEAGSAMLEVGCGDGFFLQEMQSQCSSVKGLELNSQAIDAALKKGLDVEAKTIQEFAAMHPKQFDAVVSFQVLEHIHDIRGFLSAMIDCVKPGGLLIIAVPNNNPYLFKWDDRHFLNLPPHHAGLWNGESLANLTKYFPLQLQSLEFEPLIEVKLWYKTQVAHYRKTNKVKALLLQLIPRQVYKPMLKFWRRRIPGKTVMAVYKVN